MTFFCPLPINGVNVPGTAPDDAGDADDRALAARVRCCCCNNGALNDIRGTAMGRMEGGGVRGAQLLDEETAVENGGDGVDEDPFHSFSGRDDDDVEEEAEPAVEADIAGFLTCNFRYGTVVAVVDVVVVAAKRDGGREDLEK